MYLIGQISITCLPVNVGINLDYFKFTTIPPKPSFIILLHASIDLLFSRVKVLRDETRSLPKEIFLWLDDMQVAVMVEVDQVVPHRERYSQQWSD